MKITTLIFLFFLLLVNLFSSPAFPEGYVIGNGGDFLELEFSRIGEAIFQKIYSGKQNKLSEIIPKDKFLNALNKTRIDSVKGPIIDNFGREVDARYVNINGTDVIEIDESTWYKHINEGSRIYYLVLHEYLRVLKINDDNYILSRKLNIIIDENERYSSFKGLFNAFNKSEPLTVGEVNGLYIGTCKQYIPQVKSNTGAQPIYEEEVIFSDFLLVDDKKVVAGGLSQTRKRNHFFDKFTRDDLYQYAIRKSNKWDEVNSEELSTRYSEKGVDLKFDLRRLDETLISAFRTEGPQYYDIDEDITPILLESNQTLILCYYYKNL